ncbi:MAG: ring-cleaving dioxygenase [Gemmatimonadota bacterium]
MTTRPPLSGIHHITAIAGAPQPNLDFYCGTLGLRMVKRSVNQDDPGTFHLYYGDAAGSPGSLLTFFPWSGARAGHRGPGQVTVVAFAVPPDALDFWTDRLAHHGVSHLPPKPRFGETVLPFADPDGLPIELVAAAGDARAPWPDGPVPADVAIRGLHSATILAGSDSRTARFLTDVLEFRPAQTDGGRARFETGTGGGGAIVDVVTSDRGTARGGGGAGTVHHIAWRVADDAAQEAWRAAAEAAGRQPTPVVERFYFRSVYFREPGGVLYELATDGPGFAVDEPPEALGERLALPPWLEPQRAAIEAALPPIQLPQQPGTLA